MWKPIPLKKIDQLFYFFFEVWLKFVEPQGWETERLNIAGTAIEVGKHLRYTANLALCFHKERPRFRTVSHITKNTTIGRFQRMMLYVVFNFSYTICWL